MVCSVKETHEEDPAENLECDENEIEYCYKLLMESDNLYEIHEQVSNFFYGVSDINR